MCCSIHPVGTSVNMCLRSLRGTDIYATLPLRQLRPHLPCPHVADPILPMDPFLQIHSDSRRIAGGDVLGHTLTIFRLPICARVERSTHNDRIAYSLYGDRRHHALREAVQNSPHWRQRGLARYPCDISGACGFTRIWREMASKLLTSWNTRPPHLSFCSI
jgi:hypothetical protein